MACHNRMHDKVNQVVADNTRTQILAPDTTITNVFLKRGKYIGKVLIEGKKIRVREFGFGVWVPSQ